MVDYVVSPNPTRPAIEEDKTMSQELREWTQIITDRSVIISTGSPEGVIEAPIGAEYMDDAGTASAIKYIKRDADIAGDRTKGWILI